MSCNCRDIMGHIEKIAPVKLAQDWDNVGLMIGDSDKKIDKILVALDATPKTIDEAIELKADLLVTHHPIIFKPLKNITEETPLGVSLIKLIKNDIAVYSAHTNLDSAIDGVNRRLAECIGLKNIRVFDLIKAHSCEEVDCDVCNLENCSEQYGMGRIGDLEKEVEFKEFCEMVKKALGVENIKVVGEQDNKVIKKVVVSSGAYSSMIDSARAKAVDVVITGDLKYHDARDFADNGIFAIDAGHFATENVIVPFLADYIQTIDESLEVFQSKECKDVFKIC